MGNIDYGPLDLQIDNEDHFFELARTNRNFKELRGQEIGLYYDEFNEWFAECLKTIRYEQDRKLFYFVKKNGMLMEVERGILYNILERVVKAFPDDGIVLKTIGEFSTTLGEDEIRRLYHCALEAFPRNKEVSLH